MKLSDEDLEKEGFTTGARRKLRQELAYVSQLLFFLVFSVEKFAPGYC